MTPAQIKEEKFLENIDRMYQSKITNIMNVRLARYNNNQLVVFFLIPIWYGIHSPLNLVQIEMGVYE